jgi:hypothetical protein
LQQLEIEEAQTGNAYEIPGADTLAKTATAAAATLSNRFRLARYFSFKPANFSSLG